MKPNNCQDLSPEKKLSEHFAEFIDLTDENLEEIIVPGFGHIQGGWSSCTSCSSSSHRSHRGCEHRSCSSCSYRRRSCSSCHSCDHRSCSSCHSCDHRSCSSCDDNGDE